MGNCLDLPPLNAKGPVAPRHHTNGKSHRPKSFPPSPTSGSMSRLSNAYQPYNPQYAMPSPLIVMDPNTGQTYEYQPPMGMPQHSYQPPMGMPQHPYQPPMGMPQHPYTQSMYYDNDYDYSGYGDQYDYERKSRHRHHHKRKGNAVSENSNRKSTVITTYPDPDNDIVRQDSQVLPPRVPADVKRTASTSLRGAETTSRHISDVITVNNEVSRTTAAAAPTKYVGEDGESVGMEEIRLIHAALASKEQPASARGSTYITYIENEPAPPSEVDDVEMREKIRETMQIEEVTSDENFELEPFVEISGPLEDETRLFVDDPISAQPYNTSQLSVTNNATVMSTIRAKASITETTSTNMNSDMSTSNSKANRASLLFGPRVRSVSPNPDIIIACVPRDVEIMYKIMKSIQAVGLSVFASVVEDNRSEEDATTASQAIVDAKLLVVLLSEVSAQSAQLKDEVSLGRVTNTVIFPVALDTPITILDTLDHVNIALKLQVAMFKWTDLHNRDGPSDLVIDLLVKMLRDEHDYMSSNPDVIDEDFGEVSTGNRAELRHDIIRHRQRQKSIFVTPSVTATQFWHNTYPGLSEVDWSRFRRDFMNEFRERLDSTLPKIGQLHVMDTLRHELLTDSYNQNVVNKAQFVVFCKDDEDLWEKLLSIARECLAIRDVFDVESTVRVVAIKNIGRFGSPAVMNALRELLSDPEDNTRAVATVTLSRCMNPSDTVTLELLMKSLDDSDRLVREAGCLAMGHLKATLAVRKLIDMWRNDVISQVREAASVALTEIGGPNVEEAMRLTRILADEIRTLT